MRDHNPDIKFAWKRVRTKRAGGGIDTVKRYRAVCRCGWQGPDRVNRAGAEDDEFEHRVNTGER